MDLWSYFQSNNGPLINKWKHYFPVYEEHFRPFVNKPLTFLEIGVYHGGSLQMWKHYFGPHARIIGIDILPKCKEFEEDQIDIRIGKQQDRKFLQDVLDEFGPPDIVLDDGSHMMSDMTASFRYLYPRLTKNGIYVVEDLQTCYWEEFQGGLRREGTFIELCKTLIDELNAEHCRGTLAPTDFTTATLSMHFYDGMAVLKRGTHTRKAALEIGKKTLRAWDLLPLRLARRFQSKSPSWTSVDGGLPSESGLYCVRLDDETESEAHYDLSSQSWHPAPDPDQSGKLRVVCWKPGKNRSS